MEVGQPFVPYKMFRANVIIPFGVVEHPMPGNAKLLWGMLNYHSGKRGLVYPNQEKLAERLGVNIRTVQNLVKILEDEGFISVYRPQGNERAKHFNNKYQFLWHKCLEDGMKFIDEEPEPVAKVASGASSKSCYPPVAKVAGPSKRDIVRGVPIGSGQARLGKTSAKEDSSATFRQIWFKEWSNAHGGGTYANFSYGGRDGSGIKRLHRELKGDNKRFRRACRAYFADQKDFLEGHPTVHFFNQFNRWDALAAKPTNGHANGNGRAAPATPKIISINRRVEMFTEEGTDHAQN